MNVGILIIVHKPTLSLLERVSLRQCAQVLGRHPIHLLYPKGMDTRVYSECFPELKLDPFSPVHFSSYSNFNRFKIQPLLYKQYSYYDYVLFYELDSYVFRDELLYWCQQGYDYIGAPWYEGVYLATPESKCVGVGNGGFSLRRVGAMLDVSRSFHLVYNHEYLKKVYCSSSSVKNYCRYILNLSTRNRYHWMFNSFRQNEDYYWGLFAAKTFQEFSLPDEMRAAEFSFEANAPYLYEKINKLPFGCHKWNILYPQFWSKFCPFNTAVSSNE